MNTFLGKIKLNLEIIQDHSKLSLIQKHQEQIWPCHKMVKVNPGSSFEKKTTTTTTKKNNKKKQKKQQQQQKNKQKKTKQQKKKNRAWAYNHLVQVLATF